MLLKINGPHFRLQAFGKAGMTIGIILSTRTNFLFTSLLHLISRTSGSSAFLGSPQSGREKKPSGNSFIFPILLLLMNTYKFIGQVTSWKLDYKFARCSFLGESGDRLKTLLVEASGLQGRGVDPWSNLRRGISNVCTFSVDFIKCCFQNRKTTRVIVGIAILVIVSISVHVFPAQKG